MREADATDPGRTAEPSLWSAWRRHPVVRGVLLRFVPLYRRFSLRLLGIRLSRAETGLLGELLAARHLQEKGRRILRRNHRGPNRGEVDIVARHGDVLTFVEVKTRTSAAFGRPADAVTADKQRLIQRGALDWLRLLGNPRIAIRFDIAEVLLVDGEVPRVNLIENAFTLPDSSMAGR
ncbi:MAG: hypothetical protein CJBNEKGG_01230 [Prosthecobacter sp.]|nr:hypothetical protein [Prosthecobacter sp.]